MSRPHIIINQESLQTLIIRDSTQLSTTVLLIVSDRHLVCLCNLPIELSVYCELTNLKMLATSAIRELGYHIPIFLPASSKNYADRYTTRQLTLFIQNSLCFAHGWYAMCFSHTLFPSQWPCCGRDFKQVHCPSTMWTTQFIQHCPQ